MPTNLYFWTEFENMMTFLKTILIIILALYAIKFIFRLLMPYILRYISKKAGQQFEQFFGNPSSTGNTTQPKGKVTIENMPPNQHSTSKKVGEYVDYEEVE